MPDKAFLEIFEDLVDALDALNKNVGKIAEVMTILEDAFGPAGYLLDKDEKFLRVHIGNLDDDPLGVDVQPVEDD